MVLTSTTTTRPSLMRLPLPSTFKANPWPDPLDSIGKSQCSLGREHCWEAIGPAGEISKSSIFTEISSFLQSRYEELIDGVPDPRLLMFEMYMIGRKKDRARPTILFICANKLQRQRAVKLVRQSGILEAQPAIVLGDRNRPPILLFDDIAKDDLTTYLHPEDITSTARWIFCNSSLTRLMGIEIFIPHVGKDVESHIKERKATIGGLFMIGSDICGLTVSHVFSGENEDDQSEGSGDVDFSWECESSDDDGGEVEQNLSPITSHSTSSPKISQFDPLESTKASVSILSLDHTIRPSVSEQEDTSIWRDPRRFSALNDKVKLGHVFALSTQSSTPNLDWSLIRLDQEAIFELPEIHNIDPADYILPEEVAETLPSDTDVQAFTGSHGLIRGTISRNPVRMQLPGDSFFQEMWVISLQGPLLRGDCGSWVFSGDKRTLLGHIVAGDPTNSVAYIVPAHLLFADIKKQCGSDLSLMSFADLRSAFDKTAKTENPRTRNENRTVDDVPSECDQMSVSEEESNAEVLALEIADDTQIPQNNEPSLITAASHDGVHIIPECCILPQPNLDFTGRERELNQIDNALSSNAICCLMGSSGYGKTQIAQEYAHRYAKKYSGVAWIQRGSEGVTSQWPPADTKAWENYLGPSGLVIFDDDESGDFDDLLRFWSLTGDSSRPSILITTRDRYAIPAKGVFWYQVEVSQSPESQPSVLAWVANTTESFSGQQPSDSLREPGMVNEPRMVRDPRMTSDSGYSSFARSAVTDTTGDLVSKRKLPTERGTKRRKLETPQNSPAVLRSKYKSTPTRPADIENLDTVKKNDAAKGISVRQLDSSDGKLRMASSIPTISQHAKFSTAELNKFTEASERYRIMGIQLKRGADAILGITGATRDRTLSSKLNEADEKLGTIMHLEGIMAFMLSFETIDARKAAEHIRHSGHQWATVIPVTLFLKKYASRYVDLHALLCLLAAICHERTERHQLDQLVHGKPTVEFAQEIRQNSAARAALYKKYTELGVQDSVKWVYTVSDAHILTIHVLERFAEENGVEKWVCRIRPGTED